MAGEVCGGGKIVLIVGITSYFLAMVAFGKSIRIYLKDGTVTGVKFGEVVNHTIQSISCPRNRVMELKSYSEVNRPGVYFLFGVDEESGENKAYVGEGENVFERLHSHLTTKEFWNEVICFVSKDENLTKSHVKFLESRAIQISKSINRYKIENGNQSQASSLPAADKDAMEEFLIYIKLLLGTLGHKLLEELTPFSVKAQSESFIDSQKNPNLQNGQTSSPLKLTLNVGMLKANAYLTDEGVVVLKGSEAAKEVQQSLQMGYRELRERLINNGVLKLSGNTYIFQNDYLFNTASPAAALVVGYSINGREHWKDSLGRSLKEIEKQQL